MTDPISTFLATYSNYVAITVAVCAFVAACLPAPGPDASPVWVAIYRAVNLIGANFGRAKNADDVKVAAAKPPSP